MPCTRRRGARTRLSTLLPLWLSTTVDLTRRARARFLRCCGRGTTGGGQGACVQGRGDQCRQGGQEARKQAAGPWQHACAAATRAAAPALPAAPRCAAPHCAAAAPRTPRRSGSCGTERRGGSTTPAQRGRATAPAARRGRREDVSLVLIPRPLPSPKGWRRTSKTCTAAPGPARRSPRCRPPPPPCAAARRATPGTAPCPQCTAAGGAGGGLAERGLAAGGKYASPCAAAAAAARACSAYLPLQRPCRPEQQQRCCSRQTAPRLHRGAQENGGGRRARSEVGCC